jgi:hypothetical protein
MNLSRRSAMRGAAAALGAWAVAPFLTGGAGPETWEVEGVSLFHAPYLVDRLHPGLLLRARRLAQAGVVALQLDDRLLGYVNGAGPRLPTEPGGSVTIAAIGRHPNGRMRLRVQASRA